MSWFDRSTRGMADLWLGLVRQRCLKCAADAGCPTMSPAERVELLDAAMRSPSADAYLNGIQAAFDDAGRHGDTLTVTVLRSLLSSGEIETVMRMRAEWKGGDGAALASPDIGL